MASKKAVCAIIGYGPGIGHASAAKFAKEGYKVAIMGRSMEKLKTGESTIADCKGYVADVTVPDSLISGLTKIESELGQIDVLIYNAGSGIFKNYDEQGLDEMDTSVKTNLYGLFTAAQHVCPKMEARGNGFVMVTGATASLRGKPFTASFAAAKAAQRSFAQSLARQLGPKGVHISLAIIDGPVGKGKDQCIDPDSIGETYYSIAQQDRSCWTHEITVRPFVSNW